MTDTKQKLNETTWRVVAHEERGVGGQTFLHLTLRCSSCGNASAIIVPALGGFPIEEPTADSCDCLAIKVKGEAKEGS